MTWEILVGLIAIVGCLISLGTVLAKLVYTMSELNSTMKNINKIVDDHEARIRTLERNEHA